MRQPRAPTLACCGFVFGGNGLTIVGFGIDPTGQTEAWRSTPVPEGSTSAMLAAGLAVLGMRRRFVLRALGLDIPAGHVTGTSTAGASPRRVARRAKRRSSKLMKLVQWLLAIR